MLKVVLLLFIAVISTNTVAENCYTSTIKSPTPFMGNDGEIIKLDNGSLFEIKYSYEYMYEYYPSVLICPSSGKLLFKDKKIDIRSLTGGGNEQQRGGESLESTISNQFTGLNQGNIYKLANGQIWEQIEAWSWAWSWVSPSVMIYQDGGMYKMKVEDIEHAVMVKRIK